MALWGLNWPMFIMFVIAVPGAIVLSWILPETKWWKRVVAKFFEWRTVESEGEVNKYDV